ncbi:MAG: hypothetical protein JNL87_21970 [Burkholderiaceae bacterium]|nr:hypothetical protein [Burkholderiaceae bacterium]
MTQHLKHFSVSACALAVSLLISACGGADPADSVPPTVTITDNVSAATANGPVTFTFSFSEDVGSSFAAEDITVTGGTAGTLTKVDATHYTLVVTPAAGSTGTISVGVAALMFTDLALNGNTVAASAQQAYDTTVAPPPSGYTGTCTAAPCIDFSAAGLAMTPFGGLAAEIAADPVDATNKVGKLTKVAANETWAGATIDPSGNGANVVPAIGFSTSKIITLRVYSPAAGETIMLKVENSGDGAVNMEKQATTTQSATWETLSFDYATPSAGSWDPSKVYDRVSVFPHFGSKVGADSVYYIDELKYAAASAPPVGCGTTEPTCAPTTVVPAGSIVIYNDAGSIGGLDTFPVWGQNPPVVGSEPTIAGNKVLKYSFGALYQGIDWSSNPQNVSAKGMLHLDVWSADVASVKVSLIGGGAENGITKPLTAGAWNSLDIDLSQYTSPDKTKVIQIKLEPNVAGTIYVDNIFFHGTAAGGGGGGNFTGGIFAADYIGNLSADTAQSTLGGKVGFFQDPRLYANKAFEDGGVAGTAVNPGGVPNVYYGIGKLTPVLTDAYFGGFVNAPSNGSADASAYSKIKLKFWGDAESWEKPNFTATVDVLVQGPANAACANGSGRPELLKAVTAQKIGAGSEYIIAKTDFTLVESCGGAYTVNSVWSAIGAVVVRLAGTNLQYLNSVPSTPVSFPTFINIGPISFIN